MSDIGHNSRAISAERLESFVKRIERMQEDRAGINADIKTIFEEAKGAGFDAKIMREVIRLRAMDPSEMAERRALIDVYLEALGSAV